MERNGIDLETGGISTSFTKLNLGIFESQFTMWTIDLPLRDRKRISIRLGIFKALSFVARPMTRLGRHLARRL